VSFAQRIRSSTRACAWCRAVEMGQLPDRGIGGEGGVAPPVSFLERILLRARVRALAAHDHPDPARIAVQHLPLRGGTRLY
jgi:hypothetical protein